MSSDDESVESDSTPIFRNSEDIRNDARPDIIQEYNSRPHPMISRFSDIVHNNATHLSTITFKLGDCSVTAQYVNGNIYIHSFSCNTVGSGLGKNLLHDALIHLKTMYPNFAYITIDPVPQMDPVIWRTLSPADKETHKQTALLKLAGYYKKLGFTGEIQSHDGSYPTLIGDINTILATIETMNIGRGIRGTRIRTRRIKRKQRKVVNKRKSNKKGKNKK
jgi:hypothetical protein